MEKQAMIGRIEKDALMLKNKLENVLQLSDGEREVSRFLSEHPEIIRWSFCWTGGHQTFVLKEFPFGSRYKADFVVLMSHSGGWEVYMIELEPPKDKVINKDGTPSKRFNKALSQISEWKEYIEKNPYQVRSDLAKWCVEHDLLGYFRDNDTPTSYAGDKLSDTETNIDYSYGIIIGNRNSLTKEQRNRMSRVAQDNSITVRTYGLFLDVAANHDAASADPKKLVRLSSSPEREPPLLCHRMQRSIKWKK